MRTRLCWNCKKLVICPKTFPHGRPRRESECADYIKAPPEPKRIMHKEMAEALGCSVRKIEQFTTSKSGVKFLMKALARKGIRISYERIKNRIYFYKEIDND